MYAGYSSGGFAAVAAADGLKMHTFKPLQVLSSAAPFKVSSWLPMTVTAGIAGGAVSTTGIFTVAAAIMFLSRPEYGTSVLRADLVDKYDAVFSSKDTFSLYVPMYQNPPPHNWLDANKEASPDFAALVNVTNPLSPDVYGYFLTAYVLATQTGQDKPCGENVVFPTDNVKKVCDGANQNDLQEVVETADYPINVCHAMKDNLVHYTNSAEPKNGEAILLEGPANHGQACYICALHLFADFDLDYQEKN